MNKSNVVVRTYQGVVNDVTVYAGDDRDRLAYAFAFAFIKNNMGGNRDWLDDEDYWTRYDKAVEDNDYEDVYAIYKELDDCDDDTFVTIYETDIVIKQEEELK